MIRVCSYNAGISPFYPGIFYDEPSFKRNI